MAFNQSLAGKIEPAARSWSTARAGDRLAFYREAGQKAVRVKREELARGIGSNGRRMKPRERPRRDGANGPVLTPHDDQSRTARLLTFRATAAGLTLFWHAGIRKGQRKPWGVILGFHAAGLVRGAPVRDVRLSTRGLFQVRDQMRTWWTRRVAQADRRAEDRALAATKPRPIRRALAALANYLKAGVKRFLP